ncbi:MAG: hypothetical protein QGF53_13735 [Alphaproteobacteria bacterium]|nr:hypothetical protein [Alphaproteobacteria bacterium]
MAVSAFAGTAMAEEEGAAHMLESGSLVCVSAAAYDAAAAEGGGDQASCVAVNDDQLEDMLAPFVQVEETNGDHVLVNFSVENYKKLELLHGQVTHVRYRGWTASKNLRNYYEWLTGQPQD